MVEYSIFPWGDPNRSTYTVMVTRSRNDGLYYVHSLFTGFLPCGTPVEEDIQAHGFEDPAEARGLAQRTAPLMYANGRTASEHMQRQNASR
ncbi:hypothetical protein [Rhodococcus qingshengii]|uniref:hypothetical protein n=1 Tax=Rhodococcus qingshengii TaxID=334542 RepID=UPI0035DD54EA